MISLLFALSVLVYSAYAYLPFMNLSAKAHYVAGMIFAILGSLIWVTISRTVQKHEIALNGAIFDSIITICFLAVPLALAGTDLTPKQTIGIIVMFIGMALVKF